MSITRRVFLKGGAMAVVGTAALPQFLARAAYAATGLTSSSKRLVIVFQRGAADGLNIVVPYGEAAYYSLRPTINIPRQQVLELNGLFGLHPSLALFKPLWDQKHLAIVHAAGSPDETRSHFDAQDYMESGTPGIKSTQDGWLNRALPPETGRNDSPFHAVALGTSLPRILSGKAPAVAVSNLSGFAIAGGNPAVAPIGNTFEAMYAQSVDSVLHGTGRETFEAVKMLQSADPQKYVPASGANYPKGRFGDAMRQTAQLIKSNLGVQIAFTDIGGWDHHVNEGAVQGQLGNVLREFGDSISAFWTDPGDLAEETVVITMSEFGRTAHENGNRGTDHGHANVMFVLGGPVHGGHVYGRWPGLDPSHLHEGRDLALTTDFRTVVGESIARHMGNHNLNAVFPGFSNSPQSFLRYL